MYDIITDIKALQEETLINLQNSKAKNTVRAYKSDFDDFSLFCIKNSFKSLPSEPKVISLYLTYLSSNNAKITDTINIVNLVTLLSFFEDAFPINLNNK